MAQLDLSLSAFIGQEAIKRDLRARIEVARGRSQPLSHLLLCGPSEIGKATLATAIAHDMGVNLRIVDASRPIRPGDLAVILTNLRAGDLLLMEQVESLKEEILSVLVQVIGDFSLDIIIGKGPSARDFTLRLPQFTVVGATSKPSRIDQRLRRWFIVYDLEPYSITDIGKIILLLANQQSLPVDSDAAHLVAEHCDGLPGNAAVLTKRVQRYCSTYGIERVTLEAASKALVSFGYIGRPMTSVDLAAKLRGMSGVEFEKFVAKLFRDMGYTVETTPATGDHGIDLLMRKGDELIAVQCKRWNDSVGEQVVRDFFGSLMHVGAQLGLIVATSDFTGQASAFAQDKPIRLVDLDMLVAMVLKQRKPV